MDLSRYLEFIPYSRYSSRLQAKGTSEERQHDAAAAFAAEHGITLSERRIDRGKSGFHGANLESDGALRQIINGVADGTIPTPCLLLVEQQDRFGRLPSTQALNTLFADLLDKGCDLFHLGRQSLYSSELVNRDFGSLVTLAAEIHSAHQHSALLSKRSKVAHAKSRQRIAAGEAGIRPNWAPRWIDWDAQAGEWKLNSYSATVVRLVELLESGKGQITTAKALDTEGHLTPRDKKWTPGSVSHVVYSPTICGGRPLARRTGETAWDVFPAVISRPRWEALKARLAQRDFAAGAHGPQDQMRWFGQALTFCTCGRAVGFRCCSCVVKGERVKREYLRCRGRVKAGQCDQPAVRLEAIQFHVLSRLQGKHLAQLFPEKGDGEVQRLREDVEQLRKAVDEHRAMAAAAEQQINRMLAAGDSDAVSIVARQVKLAEDQAVTAEQQLMAARGRLEALESHSSEALRKEVQGAVRGLLKVYADGADTAEDRKELNGLLYRLGVRIVVDGQRNRVGMAVGEEEVDWQPLSPGLASSLVAKGATGQRYLDASALGGGEIAIDGGITQEAWDAAVSELLRDPTAKPISDNKVAINVEADGAMIVSFDLA